MRDYTGFAALVFICLMMWTASSLSARALDLYAKTGTAHYEAAYISGLHNQIETDNDATSIVDIGLRGQPHASLRVKYDFQNTFYRQYDAVDAARHKLKLYWTPLPKTELYLNWSHADRGGAFYLLTQYVKPRIKLPFRGGILKIGPTYRDKDFHVYDNFDSNAWGAEGSFMRAGHVVKLSSLKQDAANDLYDRRSHKFSWKVPMAAVGPHRLTAFYELHHRDYFAVREDDKTKRWTRHKLRGEWQYKLNHRWKLRARAQMSWHNANLPAGAYNDRYGELVFIYQGNGSTPDDNDR